MDDVSHVAMQSRWSDRLALAVLAVLAMIAAATFRDYGLGWDDYTHSQYGDLLLKLYSSGFHDTRALTFVNLYIYGGGFDMAAALLAKIVPFDLFETRRLLGAIVGIAGLAVTWRIGRRIGGPLAGLLALVLLAACPLYYGHMFMNPKDAPFAAAMALFLLGLIRLLEQYPRPSPQHGLPCRPGLRPVDRLAHHGGLRRDRRARSAGVVVRHRGARRRNAAGGAAARPAVAGADPEWLLAYAVMALIWPWAVVNPLNPITADRGVLAFLREAVARVVRRHAA